MVCDPTPSVEVVKLASPLPSITLVPMSVPNAQVPFLSVTLPSGVATAGETGVTVTVKVTD